MPFLSPSILRQRSLNINHTRPQSAFSGVVFQYQIHNARTEFQHACFVFNYALAYKHLCVPHLCLPSEHASMTSSCLCRMEMGKAFSRKDGSSAFFFWRIHTSTWWTHALWQTDNSVFTAAEFSKPCTCKSIHIWVRNTANSLIHFAFSCLNPAR